MDPLEVQLDDCEQRCSALVERFRFIDTMDLDEDQEAKLLVAAIIHSALHAFLMTVVSNVAVASGVLDTNNLQALATAVAECQATVDKQINAQLCFALN